MDFQFASYSDLQDKTVLITGGGSGIGAAFVEAFVLQGSRVAFIDIQNEVSQGLVESLSKQGPEPLFLNCDVTDIKALKQAILTVEEELGTIGVLINNAANDERHDPEDVSPEYWEKRLKLNLNHHFFAAQAVQPKMAEAGGGSIINMGSISWHMALEFMPGYTSSKAAIGGLTVGLARAYGKDRIRVNCIIPGSVRTPRQVKEILTPEYEKFITDKQCLPDQILPEDIAQLALFLASDAGRMCTRRNFFMDAGIGA
ncbi:MAG TPA: SDR family oxidoreductase [SAR324 cluster bacterium]|nr:SDR family oxidoreductase [SAR324 cluster bacterium]